MIIGQVSTNSENSRIPELNDIIPLSIPEICGNEWKYVKECLDTGWVSSVGPFVDRFECEVASYLGIGHAVAMVNGTAALHVALRAIGLQPDEEVLVPTLTFIAPVNAIRYCGGVPIFIDAHPDSWQMDPEKVAKFLKEECVERDGHSYNRRSGRRVRAILPVHILGLACEIDRLVELARGYGLQVVEDAAEAMGVRYHGRHVGTFGDIGVFSFNGNKIMTTGGGGMIVTDDAKKAEYARYLSMQAKDDSLEYIHQEVGYNYRLSNLQAAVGIAQLEQLEVFIAQKRAIADAYKSELGQIDEITLMPTPTDCEPTYWLYTVLLRQGTTAEQRKDLIARLRREGIEARPLWHSIHSLTPYQKCQAFQIRHAIDLYCRGVSLPSSVGLTTEQIGRCVEAVRASLRS